MTQPGPAPVREGDLLAGKYRVERVLGSGGMGIVVAARHEQLDQLVAIKFVRDVALGNAEAVERFLREARAAVKLKSEHAARVLDVGTLESGAPYMVMEYLEGSDLAQVLSERGPLPSEVAADWVLQACEAVAEAHAAGIVHRDLKPQNLFLARTVGGGSKVKVLDFGVSKSMGPSFNEKAALTRTRAMLGSPLYMAPEQMRSSRDVDARADVWALGVVLFELLTQRFPFEADTMPELCLKVVAEPPLSLTALRPDASVAMAQVLERCFQKDAAKRFANAAELASALEPLAPPGSRWMAERARLAMAGLSGARTKFPVVASASAGAVPPRPALTPAAWGTGRFGPSRVVTTRRVRPAVWIGGSAGAVAAVVASLIALRGRGDRPDTPPKVAPSVALVSSPAPPPVVSLTTASALVLDPAPAPPASMPLPSDAASTSASSQARPPRPAAPQPPAAIKPIARDDDIPALR